MPTDDASGFACEDLIPCHFHFWALPKHPFPFTPGYETGRGRADHRDNWQETCGIPGRRYPTEGSGRDRGQREVSRLVSAEPLPIGIGGEPLRTFEGTGEMGRIPVPHTASHLRDGEVCGLEQVPRPRHPQAADMLRQRLA